MNLPPLLLEATTTPHTSGYRGTLFNPRLTQNLQDMMVILTICSPVHTTYCQRSYILPQRCTPVRGVNQWSVSNIHFITIKKQKHGYNHQLLRSRTQGRIKIHQPGNNWSGRTDPISEHRKMVCHRTQVQDTLHL